MIDAIIVLGMVFVLVLFSFFLDGCTCTFVSPSAFSILFGIGCGLLIALLNNASLDQHFEFHNSLFFNLLLPPIIYQAGFSVQTTAFFRNVGVILSTSILGTIIATGITGGSLYLAGQYDIVTSLSWVEAFLFGALISAIDPVATLACFNKLNAPSRLFNLLFGESVLNDAVAIALYQTLHSWNPKAPFHPTELLSVAKSMAATLLGSLVVSLVITLACAFLIKRRCMARLRQFPVYEISLCLIFSLLTYFVADLISFSGIVALFFSGTMTSHYHFYTISAEAQHSFTHLLHTLAFISESFVYVFMGISIVLIFSGQQEYPSENIEISEIDWKFIGLTFAICLVARFCNTFVLVPLANVFRSKNDRISFKYMFTIWFSGLRGAIAFALAKTWAVPSSEFMEHRRLIISTTLMVVLITTVFIGGLTGPLITCLGLVDKTDSDTRSEDNTPASDVDSIVLSDNPLPSVKRRRSSHYLMKKASLDGSLVAQGAVLTPRPQFRPPPLQIDTETDSSRSLTERATQAWRYVDDNYFKPLFGGQGQHLSNDHIQSPQSFIRNAGVHRAHL